MVTSNYEAQVTNELISAFDISIDFTSIHARSRCGL